MYRTESESPAFFSQLHGHICVFTRIQGHGNEVELTASQTGTSSNTELTHAPLSNCEACRLQGREVAAVDGILAQ